MSRNRQSFNRQLLKQRPLYQQYPRLAVALGTILGLGVVFSGPIYFIWFVPHEEIDALKEAKRLNELGLLASQRRYTGMNDN